MNSINIQKVENGYVLTLDGTMYVYDSLAKCLERIKYLEGQI